MADLSIIIVSYNTKKLLLGCIQSIEKHTQGVDYEVIVVDNASTDGSADLVRRLSLKKSDVRVIENTINKGFAAANNQGIKIAKGKYILLLNSDTKILENTLLKMISWMDKNEKVGVSTCKLLNADRSIQATGGYFPTLPRIFMWALFYLASTSKT